MSDLQTPWTNQRGVQRYLERREREAQQADADYEPGSRTVAYIRRLKFRESPHPRVWSREESILHMLSTHPLDNVRLAVAKHVATHDDTRGMMLLNPNITMEEVETLVHPYLGRHLLVFLANLHALPLVSSYASELLTIAALGEIDLTDDPVHPAW